MMSVCRLDSVSPALAERFRRATTANRRKAAILACEMAVSSVGIRDKKVLLALATLRSEMPADIGLRGQLERLAAKFDEEYLRLEEETERVKKEEALMFFSKARATSAVVFALGEGTAGLHEAIYEAIASFSDPADLVQSLEAALG